MCYHDAKGIFLTMGTCSRLTHFLFQIFSDQQIFHAQKQITIQQKIVDEKITIDLNSKSIMNSMDLEKSGPQN